MSAAGVVVTVGLLCSAGLLFYVGHSAIRAVVEAPKLAKGIVLAGHADWRSELTDGHVVGGADRADFAFVATHNGNIPAYVCAFDREMIVLRNCRGRGLAASWLNDEQTPVRVHHGLVELLAVRESTIRIYKTSSDVVDALKRSGWNVREA